MLTGYSALLADLDLEVPEPHTQSRIVGTVRRSEVTPARTTETYPKKHLHAGDFRGHLLFALKNEPTDLGVLHAAFCYFDATTQAEFLYEKIAETVTKDLVEELDFLGAYDKAYSRARAIVDMPNKKLSLFVRLAMQNNGKLANSKHRLFQELTAKEISEMEAAVSAAMTEAKEEKAEAAS